MISLQPALQDQSPRGRGTGEGTLPYAYFCQRASSSTTVRDTPSLNPPSEYVAHLSNAQRQHLAGKKFSMWDVPQGIPVQQEPQRHIEILRHVRLTPDLPLATSATVFLRVVDEGGVLHG